MKNKLDNPLDFVGRSWELGRFNEIFASAGARIAVVYGRRRVGKTTLIRRACEGRDVYLFEGLEGQNQASQLRHFVEQLAEQVQDVRLTRFRADSWKDVFQLLSEYVSKKPCVVYLEELQWMANYRDDLVTELKYVWDNYLSKNRNLTLVVCGSSPSFLIHHVMQSKALHNRSQWELPVQELPFSDAVQLFRSSKSSLEHLDGYLAIGGIPEYLRLLRSESSVYLSLCKHAFSQGGYFLHEAERVFVSSLADRPGYRAVVEMLAKKGASTKSKILKHIGESSGGGARDVFEDLEACGFIYPYSPLEFGKTSRECKWMIRDSYLHFYFRLIAPKMRAIQRGEFNREPTKALPHTEYRKWMGLAFERFCLFHHRAIASALGFSGVEYRVGPLYVRNVPTAGQLDLVFERKDRVLTVCEVKYLTAPPSKEVIKPFEERMRILPVGKRTTIQKVMISPNGCSEPLRNSGYFDAVLDWQALLPELML